MKIYRSSIPIGSCTTLRQASFDLGGGKNLMCSHRKLNPSGFPKMVAEIGGVQLYVFEELSAYYKSFLWRQADKSVSDLMDISNTRRSA